MMYILFHAYPRPHIHRSTDRKSPCGEICPLTDRRPLPPDYYKNWRP